MKGDLAIETIIRLMIVVVVVVITIQLINEWYMKIKESKLPSLTTNQNSNNIEVLKGKINKERLLYLIKACYDRYKTDVPVNQISTCYVIQSDELISKQINADISSESQRLFNITTKVSSLDKYNLLIEYDVSDDSILLE